MQTKLLRALIALVLLLVISLAVATLSAYRAMDMAKAAGSHAFALRYDWLHADLSGQLNVQGADLRIYALKRDIKFDAITLDYGNYLNLLLSLPELLQGKLGFAEQVHLVKAKMPLEGLDPEQWLASEYGDAWLLPKGLYACGDKPRVDAEVLKRMGVESLQSDVLLSWVDNAASAQGDFNVRMDLRELGVFDVDVRGLAFGDSKGQSNILETLSFAGLTLSYSDSGYIRRLSNYCELQAEQTRAQRSIDAAIAWQQTLGREGIELNDELRHWYRDAFTYGGELVFKAGPNEPLALSTLFRSFDTNLFERYRLSISLNGKALVAPSLKLSKAVFAPVRSAQQAQSPQNDARQSAPRWREIEPANLTSVGRRWLRVELLDGRRLEGYLDTVGDEQFTLRQSSANGEVSYTLNRADVISAWRRTQP